MLTYRSIEVEGRDLQIGDKVLLRGKIWKVALEQIPKRYGLSGLPGRMLVRREREPQFYRATGRYQKLVKRWWMFWWPW